MSSISRREAGKLLLAGCAGTLLPAGKLCGATRIDSVIRGVQIGAQSYSFRDLKTPEAILKGFQAVGLGECELSSGGEPGELRGQAMLDHFKALRKEYDDGVAGLKEEEENKELQTRFGATQSEIEYRREAKEMAAKIGNAQKELAEKAAKAQREIDERNANEAAERAAMEAARKLAEEKAIWEVKIAAEKKQALADFEEAQREAVAAAAEAEAAKEEYQKVTILADERLAEIGKLRAELDVLRSIEKELGIDMKVAHEEWARKEHQYQQFTDLQNEKATDPSSRLSAQDRKQRDEVSNRAHDDAFVTEISTTLLSQVRNLQALLAEKEETLRRVTEENSVLKLETDGLHERLSDLEQSQQTYRDQNWSLDTQIHELITNAKEATERETKLTQRLDIMQAEKDDVRKRARGISF